MGSGIPVDVVAQEDPEDGQKVDVNIEPQRKVQKDEMEGDRRGAPDGDVREKEPRDRARGDEGVEDHRKDRA